LQTALLILVAFLFASSSRSITRLALLEEAALDGIPALIIDPMGNLGNLLLTFPQFRPVDFDSWIDPAEGVAGGQSSPPRFGLHGG
jgi:hypothetical protein